MIRSAADLVARIEERTVGDRLNLAFLREGQRRETEIVLRFAESGRAR